YSNYFRETLPENYTFLGFYKYRRQQSDFTFSYQKESRKLRCDLVELMKEDSEVVRVSANQLLQNYKIIPFFYVEGFFLSTQRWHLRFVHLMVCVSVECSLRALSFSFIALNIIITSTYKNHREKYPDVQMVWNNRVICKYGSNSNVWHEKLIKTALNEVDNKLKTDDSNYGPDLNNEIENFFQSSNLFGKVNNETDSEKDKIIHRKEKHKRDEFLQHAIEQEALFEGLKLQTPKNRENEFGPEQKKIKPNESDEEEIVVSHDSQFQAQQRTPERQFSPSTSVPEVIDTVFEPQPMGWEFDEPEPTWLKKVINRQKFLISQTDPSSRYKSSLSPIWWRIIDASDPKITSDLLTEADMSELIAVFASVLNVGNPTEDWAILEPSVERCLQALAKLDNDHLSRVGKIVQLEGSHGAILEIQKIMKNVETSSLSVSLFGDEDTNDKVKPTPSVEEKDYLNPDVQFILDLVRFTCEMLAKGIPQRKYSERDVDVFIKRHLFSCFDNILDSHFGEMVSRASRDRRVGAIDTPETTEGYHTDWMFTNEAISVEGGGMLSKQEYQASHAWILISLFFIRAFLVVYIGGGFYSSVNLADFDIPTTYSELGSIIRVSRIMLQVKKLLNLTVCRFKLMKERAFKEKFTSGKVLMNARLQEYRSPQKPKKDYRDTSMMCVCNQYSLTFPEPRSAKF
ncbi:12733_t:CDS:10, partial [Funneliformis caledonium]